MSDSDPDLDFLTRDDVLGGLPARRASALLFAIESRTAHLALRARQVGALYLTDRSAAEQEQSFLDALAQGRAAAKRLRIQDLERYAPLWASLVPPDANVRAAIARLLTDKFRFTSQDVPALRRALGLDEAAVQDAFQRLYTKPLASVYQIKRMRGEQWRWAWARGQWRLEDLPPFWSAFTLTLTETIGAGILALPIAFAGIGPIGGVLVLIVLGVINLLTIVGISEAIVRNGNMRYGNHYFGRLVYDYFGNVGAWVLNLSLLLLNLLVLPALYVGVSTTLGGATALPALVWAALLFLVQLYFLRRESIDATIASALLIGAVNIGLILILTLLALPHLDPEYLAYFNLPLVNGRPFDAGVVGLIFGVVLTAYFGHTSAGNVAKVVLRRDLSGRALVWGNLAAMVTAMVLLCAWVIAVNGTVDPAVLATQSGTALVPLAATVGPSVYVFGSLFAVLGMGMGSIYAALGLFFQVREWLPRLDAKPNAARSLLNEPRLRFVLSIAPVVLIFVWVEYLLWTQRESFTGLLSFLGTLVVPILGGIFPMLLLAASRRKADYLSGVSWRWLGNPLVVGAVYLFFLASLLLHGLVVWQDPIQRVLALAVAGLLIGFTIMIVRRRAFAPRAVVELRVDRDVDERASFNSIATGQPAPAQVFLRYKSGEKETTGANGAVPDFGALQSAAFAGTSDVSELKVWAHAITPEGDSHALPIRGVVRVGETQTVVDLDTSDGQAVVPLLRGAWQVRFDLMRKTVADALADLE